MCVPWLCLPFEDKFWFVVISNNGLLQRRFIILFFLVRWTVGMVGLVGLVDVFSWVWWRIDGFGIGVWFVCIKFFWWARLTPIVGYARIFFHFPDELKSSLKLTSSYADFLKTNNETTFSRFYTNWIRVHLIVKLFLVWRGKRLPRRFVPSYCMKFESLFSHYQYLRNQKIY